MSIDCHKEFQNYLKEIKITKTRKDNLKNSKNAIRKKIKKWFDEKEKNKPLFKTQGSFSMKTLINQEKGDYDIDDGIYLQNLDDKKADWPKTETVHDWIQKAVDGHTNTPPKDKKNCVRVIYERQEKEDSYHVDLPIYNKDKNEKYYLARKGEDQWVESNSKDFDDWFRAKVKEYGEQFRAIITYLKGWKDFKGYDIPGIIFTVLVELNFIDNEKDDNSFFETTKEICKYLKNNKTLNRPIEPKENIFDNWSDNKKEELKECFNSLKNKLESINNCNNKKEACEKYRKNIFGYRFSKCENDNENKNHTRYFPLSDKPKNYGRY